MKKMNESDVNNIEIARTSMKPNAVLSSKSLRTAMAAAAATLSLSAASAKPRRPWPI